MKIILRIIVLAILGAMGFWLWTVLFPGPEKIVLKKMAALASTATFSSDASNITRAGKASSVVSMFSTDAQIVFSASGSELRTISGREEIRELALAGFGGLPSLDAGFLDASAKVGADKQSAEVSCTAKIQLGGQKDYWVQEMRFQFKKIEGDWLITRAETVKTLQ
jgi:hypothetical protein